ncbi:hypothetical protein [Dehalobacter sp. DCM]|uniref:hypothetical protein n=1 Tax=Dehalobacter sp. DCM TaxID=2907827 RepID=UPI00308145E3
MDRYIYPAIFEHDDEGYTITFPLTIPKWLNDLGEEKKVNFSQLLQNALKKTSESMAILRKNQIAKYNFSIYLQGLRCFC